MSVCYADAQTLDVHVGLYVEDFALPCGSSIMHAIVSMSYAKYICLIS